MKTRDGTKLYCYSTAKNLFEIAADGTDSLVAGMTNMS